MKGAVSLWKRGSTGRKWNRFKDDSSLSEIQFEIVGGKKQVPIFDDYGNPIDYVSSGVSLNIRSNEERLFPHFKSNAATAVPVKIKNKYGWIQLSHIKNPFHLGSTTKIEDQVFNSLKIVFNSLKIVFDKIDEPFSLHIDKKFEIKEAFSIIQPKGTPKADFVITDKNGKELCFISHKKGGGAMAFQQYGGIHPTLSKLKRYGTKEMIDEIDQFIEDTSNFLIRNPDQVSTSRIYRPIKSKKLIGFSIFGPEYGSAFSLENVNIIGQGDAILEPYRNGYNLTFSEKVHHNSSNMNWAMTGPYEALLIARNSTGERRSMYGINKNIKVENRRGGIFPRATLTGRSVEI